MDFMSSFFETMTMYWSLYFAWMYRSENWQLIIWTSTLISYTKWFPNGFKWYSQLKIRQRQHQMVYKLE